MIFNEQEINFIRKNGFSNFNGTNLDIKNDDDIGNPLFTYFFMLQRHTFSIEEKESYFGILGKLLNSDYNFNLENNSGSTIISNLIQLGDFEMLEIVLSNGKNIQSKYWESKFGDTYIDLALAFRNKNPEIFDKIIFLLTENNYEEKSTKIGINELINNNDFFGIIEYCTENTLIGNKEEIASSLYNIANLVGQEYNNNNLAIGLYEESIKYIDTDATVYNNLATTYKRIKNYTNAIKYYKLALIYDENNSIRYLRVSWLYAYIGNDEEAIKYLKKYFEKGGDDMIFINLCKTTFEGGEDLLKLYNLL